MKRIALAISAVTLSASVAFAAAPPPFDGNDRYHIINEIYGASEMAAEAAWNARCAVLKMTCEAAPGYAFKQDAHGNEKRTDGEHVGEWEAFGNVWCKLAVSPEPVIPGPIGIFVPGFPSTTPINPDGYSATPIGSPAPGAYTNP